MARDPVELAALKRGTADFIATDPDAIVFLRTTREEAESGGWIEGPAEPLAPQVVKIQAISSLADVERRSPAGQVVRPTHLMVGMPSLDTEYGDEFEWRDQTWAVTYVDRSEEYVTKAEVIRGGH